MTNKITNWLKRQLKQSGAKGFVLGLSGGVDSAVVAALCKKAALGEVLGIMMPIESHKKDLEHAKLLAKKFNIKTKVVNLTSAYKALLKTFPPANKLAKANLKPRLRMVTLYYFANKLNYLVVGTGNKSEIVMSYFTKYGDGGVDLLPLAGLLKTQVRKLACNLGIPQCIVDKPPSAGLWSGQTDEGEMGISYCQLDEIIRALDKKKKPNAPKGLVEKVRKRKAAGRHKCQMPACP